MRQSRSSIATILLGLGVLGISAAKAFDLSRTALALFIAAAILIELFEESDRGSRTCLPEAGCRRSTAS